MGGLLILKSVLLKSQFRKIASKLLDGTMLSAVGYEVNKRRFWYRNYPSMDWIRWLLMGGATSWSWANTVNKLETEIDEKLISE